MSRTNIKILLILLIFLLNTPLSAAPKVVVSVAPLHSLVAALMDGVAVPTLLLEQDVAYDRTMDNFQKSRLLTADIMIWSGPGLETSIAQTLEQMPLLEQKLLTLSNYVPLLGRHEVSAPIASRQLNRELGFWNDPRLASMAVRMITPRLVRLDPDHQEQYLDNEIRLLNQLKDLEREIADRLSMFESIALEAMAGIDPYFSHRFVITPVIVSSETQGFNRVAIGRSNTCAKRRFQPNFLKPGPTLYFESMRTAADHIASCMQHRKDAGTLASHEERQYLSDSSAGIMGI